MANELDASAFQRQLETLAEVIAQKLRREAPKLMDATPSYVSLDLHVMLRQMIYTYNLQELVWIIAKICQNSIARNH
jgi:hypothetical protein